MNCVEREKKRPDAREPKLLELCVIPLADEEFVCWENTKHPNYQNNKKYCHSLLGFLLFIQEFIMNFSNVTINMIFYIFILQKYKLFNKTNSYFERL